jgi:preprotein translocase subunit SecA
VPAILDKLLRAGEKKILRRLESIAGQVSALEDDISSLSDEELRDQTAQFRERLAEGETLDDLLPEAFATVREAGKRVLGKRLFDVQIMGAAALHLGNIAEMKTGEGKTIVATAPAYLNALPGRGVHIVTVNDYLAQFQGEQMGRIFHFLGMTTGFILASMTPDERRAAYLCDITYGTNNEFGFDYLRDNMAWTPEDCVQRGHVYAIVDEVDSILIDEARTPLIISGPAEQSSKWYTEFATLVKRMRPDEHYEVDIKKRTIGVLEPAIDLVEDTLGIDNLYESANTPLVQFLNNAVRAKELFIRDKDYVVMNGEVLIVDEHTGRILEGRRYNEGMHQAIEAKEAVAIKDENQTLATITLQNFFRLYEKLAGMTGTAMTEASEFSKIYNLGVVPIPTNMPMIRLDQADVVYRTHDAKFEAVVEDITERHAAGQPVLVGTTSVEQSEELSTELRKAGVPHAVLNAKQHAKEAQIIAQAGRKGAVTVATNMAGRGTDIMLGGNAEALAEEHLRAAGLDPLETPDEYEAAWASTVARFERQVEAEHQEVVATGGLYVLATERHESRRIDNQLRGRSGRQGDPGESRFYLSLQDELLRRFKAEWIDWVLTSMKIPDDVPIENKRITSNIANAQGQVESMNFEIRRDVLKYDDVMNRQRSVVYDERKRVLTGQDVHDELITMIDDTVADYVHAATGEGFGEDWDLEQLLVDLRQLYPVGVTLDELEERAGGSGGLNQEFLIEALQADAQSAYVRREETLGADVLRELERRVILSVLDRRWREHLYEMDYLREGIGLRAMAQRDPLVEYQREGYDLFRAMMSAIKEESVGYVFNLDVQMSPAADEVDEPDGALQVEADASTPPTSASNGAPNGLSAVQQAATAGAAMADRAAGRAATAPKLQAKGLSGAAARPSRLSYSAAEADGSVATHTDETGGSDFAGTPKNARCPCGSGLKYKRCHGKEA